MRARSCMGRRRQGGAKRALHELRDAAPRAAYRAIESAGAGARRAVDIGGLRGCRYALALGMRVRACLGCIAGRGDTTLVRGVHASRRVRLGAGSKNLTVATRKLFS